MVGAVVGWFLDRKLNTFPIVTLVLLVLGFAAGAREVWRTVKQAERDDKRMNSPNK
jgi:F0F1-type ATP synthase assembly protein I